MSVNFEYNQIIMRNGKSNLLKSLMFGDTLIIGIAAIDWSGLIPYGCMFHDFESFSDYMDWTRRVEIEVLGDLYEPFDRIIFYTNNAKCKSEKYIETISSFINIDKCVFMFNSEM